MADKLETVDDLNFEQEVLRSELPYMLEFSATWCSPCRALQPILETVAGELRGQLRVGKVDMDESPAVAARYGVRGAPTVIVFRDGKEHGRKLGLTQKRVLLELARAAMSRAPCEPSEARAVSEPRERREAAGST